MIINPEIMKDYRVKSVEITREIIQELNPDPIFAGEPYEVIMVKMTNGERRLEISVDMQLCKIATPDEPVRHALFDAMWAFKDYMNYLDKQG